MLLPQVHQTHLITQMIAFSVTVLVCEKQMLTYMLSVKTEIQLIRLIFFFIRHNYEPMHETVGGRLCAF